ncbi:DoxX-like protein [Sinobacterium caligoides]|uniref:DoxX-like protein n=1 Tax=Sinobacterium caligoides TaxID=933926 RepID=A0A3N2DQV8_9GAMM|nr:DoxX-like family protein [Sinobacterium caligoides]ROS02052.1 DoxX-like protein [Sinobacterium caligoides]
MNISVNLAARLSLALLWIFTAATSAIFAQALSYQILAAAGIDGSLASICLYSGSIVDLLIGVWLLYGRQLRHCYWLQLIIITLYTVLLTVIDAHYWLHPFGPLTKNIPLLVMIYYLYRQEKELEKNI